MRNISGGLYEGRVKWCFCDFVCDFLYKSMCLWCSFELNRQVETILFNTNNICVEVEGTSYN